MTDCEESETRDGHLSLSSATRIHLLQGLQSSLSCSPAVLLLAMTHAKVPMDAFISPWKAQKEPKDIRGYGR